MKVNTLKLGDKGFPERLVNIPSCPKKLYTIGNTQLLNSKHNLSVVGSRKITSYGKQITSSLVEDVAQYDVVIISGLALGVDAAAHKAALSVKGKTIAVMPSGLDSIYPSSHRNLALQILEQGGLLVSEYEAGTPPLRHNFVARNRIVSGLGDGTLITEASSKSGTIHTANFALGQGKVVLAVPGNITSPQSEGTNNLIKVGAVPVSSSSDIFDALGLDPINTSRDIKADTPAEARIINLIQSGITDGTELLNQSELDTITFSQTLTMLEITRRIKPLSANNWGLC